MSGKIKNHHEAAHGHVSGEAEYIDDRPMVNGEVFVEVVFSPVAHGKIRGINKNAAFKIPGVLGIFSAKNIAHNNWGTIIQDQPYLAQDIVQYVGEPILIIAGLSREC